MVLLAGVESLLHKYTGEERVLLGIPVAKSGNGATKPINHLLLLKNTLDSSTTFKALLSQIKTSVGEAIEHQNIPFGTILNYLTFNVMRMKSLLFTPQYPCKIFIFLIF